MVVCMYVPDGVDDVGAPWWVVGIMECKCVLCFRVIFCNAYSLKD